MLQVNLILKQLWLYITECYNLSLFGRKWFTLELFKFLDEILLVILFTRTF